MSGPAVARNDHTWLACEYPERPLDLDVAFHIADHQGADPGCRFAILAAQARSGSIADDICFGRRATRADRPASIIIAEHRARRAQEQQKPQ